MKEIKTREHKRDIRALDKSGLLAERMKDSAIKTKQKAEQGVYANENSPDEYASDRVEKTIDRAKDRSIYEFNKQGQKGLQETKKNIAKTREKIKQYKAKGKTDTPHNPSASQTSPAIRTRQGSNTVKQPARTIKKAQKNSIKTTKNTVKTAKQTAKTTVKTAKQTAKAAEKTAKATVKASQRAAQAARVAAKAAVTTAKAAVKATIAAVKAIIAGTKALIAAIAAGGWVAVVVIIVICLIALIAGSCFGIFFSNEDTNSGGTPMTQVVAQLNTEYYDKIEQIKSGTSYDEVEVIANDGVQAVKWNEVLAVYAVKVTTDGSGADVVTITDDKIETLRQVLWDMNSISHSSKTTSKEVDVVETDADGKETTVKKIISETMLTINLTHKSYTDMISAYGLNAEQTKQLNEMMSSEYDTMWAQLLGGYSAGTGEILISNSEHIPTDIFSWALPESYTISSPFGYRADPFTGKTKFHGGLDIAAPAGTPILAAADGVVIVANSTDSWGYGYGYHIKIKHNDTYETLYAHCSKIAVSYGQEVKKGQIIGYVGTTGNSTGNHLHFEVYKDGERTNPLIYFG